MAPQNPPPTTTTTQPEMTPPIQNMPWRMSVILYFTMPFVGVIAFGLCIWLYFFLKKKYDTPTFSYTIGNLWELFNMVPRLRKWAKDEKIAVPPLTITIPGPEPTPPEPPLTSPPGPIRPPPVHPRHGSASQTITRPTRDPVDDTPPDNSDPVAPGLLKVTFGNKRKRDTKRG